MLLWLMLFTVFSAHSRQTQQFATELKGNSNVVNPNNAVDGNLSTSALIESAAGVLGIGEYDGEIHIGFPGNVPANTTTYVKLDLEPDFFNILLGGGLGDVLSDVLGSILFGKSTLSFEVLNATNGTVLSKDLDDNFDSSFRVFTGRDGSQYLAITPNAEYRSIKIVFDVSALIGGKKDVGLYGAYYYSTPDPCYPFIGAAADGSGITLKVLENPNKSLHQAIDGDINTYSEVRPSLLELNVGSTISQVFYLDQPSRIGDEAKITMSIANMTLNLGLLESIEVVLHNGDAPVLTKSLDEIENDLLGLVNLDLLGLLSNNETITFPIGSNVVFDKVEVKLASLLGLGALSSNSAVRVHEIEMTAGTPVINGVDANRQIIICTGESPTLTATPETNGDEILWYDAPVGGRLLHTGATFNPGPLYTETKFYAAAKSSSCSESIRSEVIVTINPNPTLTLNGSAVYSANLGGTVNLPSVNTSSSDGSPVTVHGWSGNNGAPYSGTVAGPFNQPGTYVYRYSATGSGCTNFVEVYVTVIDPDGCNFVNNRVIANNSTVYSIGSLLGQDLGSITDIALAGDQDLATHSILTETVGLLGLTGQTSQTLSWNHTVLPGTPVTVKLGKVYGLAGVANTIQLQAVMNGIPVGQSEIVDPLLVSLLNGVNIFEHTFVPASGGVPVQYNGVKVTLVSGVANVAQTINIYGAYYNEVGSTLADCGETVVDVMHGFEALIGGLDLASGLTAVNNPTFAVDGDLNTYAVLNNAVGVNVSTKLDVSFAAPAIQGDSIFIKIGTNTALLDLTVLNGLSIQRYLGTQPVGSPLAFNSSLINLQILTGQTEANLSFINDQPFDRIKILMGGLVSALDALRIYEIKFVPKVSIPNLNYDPVAGIDFLEICQGGTIAIPTVGCDQFKFYTSYDSGTEVTLADIQSWPAGTVQKVYVQPVRFGCELGDHRYEIEIRITDVPTPVISPADDVLASDGDNVTLEVSNLAQYAAGVTFEWYKDGNIISGENGPTLTLTNIDASSYGEYVAIALLGSCSSPASLPTTLYKYDVVGWKSYQVSTGNSYVSGGEEITYTIQVRNNSTIAVSGISVTDAIPANTSYVANSATPSASLNANVLTWDNIDITAGNTVALTFKVKVNDNVNNVTSISNVAYVKKDSNDPGSPTYPPADNDNPDNPDTTTDPKTDIPVHIIHNFDVEKTADQANVVAGTTTSFTVTITNNGPSVLASGSQIKLLERPGAGVVIDGYSITSGAAVVSGSANDATVTTNAEIPVGGVIVVKIDATVLPEASGNITNGISVWPPNVPPTDPPIDEDTDPIPVDRVTDLSITKVVDNNSPFVSSNVVFTLTVQNHGPSKATGVEVTDLLPDGFNYVNSNPGVGTYDPVTGLWNIGDLDFNQIVVLEITAEVLATGDYVNTATVTGTETDPDLTNNTDTPDAAIVPIDNSSSNMQVLKNNAVANGVDENRVEVTLLDPMAQGIPNVDVTFLITYPDASTVSEVITTNNDGKALLVLTSTLAGDVVVAASAPGHTISGSPRTLKFIVGPVDHSASELVVIQDNAIADGIEENILEATIVDANNNPIASTNVVFGITSPNGTSTRTVATDANGKARLVLKSTTAGTVTVTASVGGTAISGSPKTVTFVAGPVDYTKSTLVVVKDNSVADGTDENRLKATLLDANNNKISQTVVSFEITDVDQNTRTETITTDANGEAILNVTSTKPGAVTVAAEVSNQALSGSPKTVTFVAGAVDYSKSTLVVIQNNAVADGIEENILEATIVDANSNPIANVAVDFGITFADNTNSSQTVTTDANGKARIELTSTVAGNVIVTAEVANTAISGSPQTVTFVVGPVDHTKSTLEVIKDNAIADGVDANILEATVVDTHGNPIQNSTVEFDVTLPDNSTITRTVTTDAYGKARIDLTSTTAGSTTVSASVGGTELSGSPKTVTFTSATNLNIYKTADQNRVIAGAPTTFTLTIRNNGPVALAAGSELLVKERPGTGVEITGFELISGNATLEVNGLDVKVVTTNSIPLGGEIKIRVNAKISTDATGTISNGVAIWGPDTPPTDDPDDEDDTPDVPVDYSADLAIEKTVDVYNPIVGDVVTFTLNVKNNGPSHAKGVKVEDQLPSGFEYVSSVASRGSYNVSNHTWELGDFDAGDSEVLTIKARVLSTGDYLNIGKISGQTDDPDLSNNTDSPDQAIVPQPKKGLSGSKTANRTQVEVGQEIEFTITITNQGPNVIESGKVIQVQEIPSAGLTLNTFTVSSGNANIEQNGMNIKLTTTQELGVNQSVVLKIVGKVNENASGNISNKVRVWGPDKNPDDDTPDFETETPELPVDNSAGISVTKVSNTPTVITNKEAEFTITLTNNGPGILTAGKTILVKDTPSTGLTIKSFEITSGNATLVKSGNDVTVTVSNDVAKGGTITIKVIGDVNAAAGQTISNGVKVWGPDTPPTDNPDDEDETPDVPVVDNYTLSVTKVADENRVTAGSTTTFTITVKNNGPETIPSGDKVFLTEKPGAGVTIERFEVVSGPATIQNNGNRATITTNGELAKDQTIVVRVHAKVDVMATGSITNGIAVWNQTKNPDLDTPDDETETSPIPVDSELFIPNMFTPNGDGLNDRFVIRGIQQYNQRELIILNRWGTQVYNNKNYNNDWDGSNLIEGTYYYILRVKGQGDWIVKTGPIAIVRNTNR